MPNSATKTALIRTLKTVAAGALGSLLLGAGPSTAQQWPSQPVQIIVPFAPGGSVDITFRTIAPSLSKRLGQPVVIINKAGGGATIGMNDVAKAKPDGYTLGAASFAFGANPVVLDSMPYDPIKDFTPITMVATSAQLILVNQKSPATNLQEFIEWVKSKPGELNFGSVGVGSSGHMITELFVKRAGLKMTHVPFTAGPLPPLSQNQIQLQIGPIPSAIPWVRDGRLRALAVTSLQTDPSVPDLPTVAKTLPGFESYEWPGLVGPANMPKDIVDRIQREVAEVIKEPEIKEKFANLGSVGVGSTPAEFAAFIKKDIETWKAMGRNFSTISEQK